MLALIDFIHIQATVVKVFLVELIVSGPKMQKLNQSGPTYSMFVNLSLAHLILCMVAMSVSERQIS